MTDLAFRSMESITQSQFAHWIESVPANDLHHYELLDGFVVMEPSAGWPHGGIEVRITSRLQAYLDEHPRGQLLGSSQGFELPSGDTVEPDAAFVASRRWKQMHKPIRGFLRVVPDLVVEILSPGTHTIDRGQKKRIYERNGVREYWLVDPQPRTVQVFRSTDGGFDEGQLYEASETLSSEVLRGFQVVVADLFPDE